MRFKRTRLFIAVGTVVATMSFTGAAMASSNHNTKPVVQKASYTHNHSTHQNGWQNAGSSQSQPTHNHTTHTSGQQSNSSSNSHDSGSHNTGGSNHE